MMNIRLKILSAFFFAVTVCPEFSSAYSVLSHEAIIDATWKSSIEPLLKKKYPGATEEQLKKARSYVYGGSIVPDLGYFPLGNVLFTDLLHYVRSGDFVSQLLNDARNLDEYAFALGVLCHYYADEYGHPIGTNPSVPILFPKLKEKFGDTVTYNDNPVAHIRTEFSFDVLQVVQSDYKTIAYHDFIGFSIADSLLEQTFRKIYGLNIRDIFVAYDKTVGTFRWTVRKLIPQLTKDAWLMKKTYFFRENPNASIKDFVSPKSYIYHFEKKSYVKEFGNQRRMGGPRTWITSFFIRVFPKIGPLKMLKFTEPVPKVVELYNRSIDTVVLHYSASLKKLYTGKADFKNIDFDTGKKTVPGEYPCADETYCALLKKLEKQEFRNISPELGKNILEYFDGNKVAWGKKNAGSNKKIVAALEELRTVTPY